MSLINNVSRRIGENICSNAIRAAERNGHIYG